jgi:hypothetical protein
MIMQLVVPVELGLVCEQGDPSTLFYGQSLDLSCFINSVILLLVLQFELIYL